MDLGLAGKNAVVTGGAGGVGAAICALLAAEGANVVVSDLALERAEAVAERCRARGVKAAAIRTDLLVPEDCAGLVDRTVEILGSADILVNNAGLWPTHLVTEIPLDEWRRTVDVNLTAVFLSCQRFVDVNLGLGRKGKILNVTSQAAFNGSTTGHAHYAAAKSGVVTFTISLSREVAAKGINVNALALGMVETPMSRDALGANREYYEKRIQIGRIATPEEVARFAVFLVSAAADYFTGATYDATGGMLSR
jgi:3-oxoacyl-[acyl-carrier protein] reductase